MSEKHEEGLYYFWGGGSKANPTKRGYITGQMWTTVDKLRGIDFKNRKTNKNCIKFDNFKFHPDYIQKTKMPGFRSNAAHALEMSYPALSTTESVLFIGGAGSGKTVWLRNLIAQTWYKKAVIFSKKADNEVFFFRPGIDIMLSPKVEAGSVHDILSEDVQYIQLYVQTLMNAAIGDKKDFFSGTAMNRLQTMAQRVKINSLDNASSVTEKWIMFIKFIEESIEEAATGDQKSLKDVMETAKSVLDLLYLMAYRVENGATTFTVEQFFKSNIPNQRLFLTGTDTSLESLLSASLAVLVKYQLAMPDINTYDSNYLVAYFLDEYLSLDKIIDAEVLSEMSRVGRSKGICTFKGIQFIQSHEKKKTQELIASVTYIMIFSTTDTDTLKILQTMAGEIEYRYEDVSKSKTGSAKATESRSTKTAKKQVLDDHMIKTLQLHDYAHITYLPKADVLYMGSNKFVEFKKRSYIDFSEIDTTEFFRWKINREDKIKAQIGAKNTIVKNAAKHYGGAG